MKKVLVILLVAMFLVACGSSNGNTNNTVGEYTDGTYTATATGFKSDVTVETTIAGGVITSVEVTEQDETPDIADPAIETLTAAIVAANGVEGVDTVSGATGTSNAVLDAVSDTLTEASGN